MPQLSVYVSDDDLARLDAFVEQRSKTDVGSANRSRGVRGLIRTLPAVVVPIIRERRRSRQGAGA